MWVRALVVIGILAAATAEAAPDPAVIADARPAPAWPTYRGTRDAGRLAGSFVVTTDGGPGRFSTGEARAPALARLPYQLDVTWRRLGPEAGRSMHVTVGDGVLLIKHGKVALYSYDEAVFAARGWHPVPGLRSHDLHHLTVTQDRRELVVAVDGEIVVRYPHPVARDRVVVGVGLKGASGFRSRLYVRDVTVRELP